jgi:tetratricopeptide (TPR) repeat protein
LKEGRIPQALELAKQHFKYEPGPAAEALLRKCYLASAEAQVARGAFRDAHSVLSEAEKLPVVDPVWWVRLAEMRADLGDHARAMQLLEKAPGSDALPRILGRVADRAVREGPAGKEFLSADLKPQFDAVRKAFADYEAGRDDAARESLNAIGIASPFLEWKLLLRGLIAWSANDSARAIENWSRLSPDRTPARLAAPFRFLADKNYAANLPANRYTPVVRQVDSLSGGVCEGLRRLRKQLASEDTVPDALETARAITPEMKRVAPDLVPRLANVVYWALVTGGQPEDMPRFNRIFGPPQDDPQFFRLQALVGEGMQRLDMAHGMWAKYEDWIAKTPARWPGKQGDRARALVLERMGRLARDWLDDEGDDSDDLSFFEFFETNRRKKPKARRPLTPSAEECYRKASELAPDWITPAMSLLREYAGDPVKAHTAVAEVLNRFPNDLVVLESAGDFYVRIGDTTKAHECIKRALAANPLDRNLRVRAAGLALNDVRRLALGKDLDAARSALREARELGASPHAVHALAAAIELRAGNTEAARTHQDALMTPPEQRLAGIFRFFVELSRLKLKKKDLDPHQTAFTSGLSEVTSSNELAALVDAVAEYSSEPVAYRGLKTHQKKVLDRIQSLAPRFGEVDLVKLGLVLHGYSLFKPLQVLGDRGCLVSPNDAHFPFFQAEAMLARRRSGYVSYPIGLCYRRTKVLIESAKDGRYQRLQELLNDRINKTPEVTRWLDARWDW